jgi:hypothetical protein
MRIRQPLLALTAMTAMAGLAAPAIADQSPAFPVVTKAHEVELSGLRLPGGTNGTLGFKPCGDCDFKTVRVTLTTRYEANGQDFNLHDFRNEVGRITDRRNAAVTVKHHLASDTITVVRVTTF